LFSATTYAWITSSIQRARQNGFTVFGMMHHGAAEHFAGQKALFPDYVIDDWAHISREFADLGMSAVFTGHFHAQDVVEVSTESGGHLFDIETGSTVTYPCPYRLVNLNQDGTLVIDSRRIENVNWPTGGLSFQEYARAFLYNGLTATYPIDGVLRGMIPDMLVQMGFPVPALPRIEPYIPLIGSTFVDHYQGDETLAAGTYAEIRGFITLLQSISPELAPLGQSLLSLLSDPMPADNDLKIDLKTGEITP